MAQTVVLITAAQGNLRVHFLKSSMVLTYLYHSSLECSGETITMSDNWDHSTPFTSSATPTSPAQSQWPTPTGKRERVVDAVDPHRGRDGLDSCINFSPCAGATTDPRPLPLGDHWGWTVLFPGVDETLLLSPGIFPGRYGPQDMSGLSSHSPEGARWVSKAFVAITLLWAIYPSVFCSTPIYAVVQSMKLCQGGRHLSHVWICIFLTPSEMGCLFRWVDCVFLF